MTKPQNKGPVEGGLQAPTRHPIAWREEHFYDEDALNSELTRVFDICHGCRRCVSLCDTFPTLFDLVDESPTLELDGVNTDAYGKVVEQCFMCDLCYQTKCPYVPPHEWEVDFPHLMLRAKARRYRDGKTKWRDRLLTSTDAVGALASAPVVNPVARKMLHGSAGRKLLESTLGVHRDAPVPNYERERLSRRTAAHQPAELSPQPAGRTRGRVALLPTCYCEFNAPAIAEDAIRVFEHNGVPVQVLHHQRCCGMPKYDLGDLQAVEALALASAPELYELVSNGWDLIAPVPSCVLMYRNELPLLLPESAQLQTVSQHIFDPLEYLALRHNDGLLNTAFTQSLGRVSYQVACHQRVQNIGARTRQVLELVPDTEVQVIERCSGHDGTYAVKRETYEKSAKIARPVVRQVQQFDPAHYTSDCPMAINQIGHHLTGDGKATGMHPLSLLRHAYGI